MVKHIVFFKLEENAEGKSKIELAEYIKAELENLKNVIPEIKMIEVGINVPNAPKTDYDIALNSEFDSFEALDIYQNHPAHLKVAGFIGKVRTVRAAVDYIF